MKYSDIYRLYSTSQPKDAIHQCKGQNENSKRDKRDETIVK